MADPPRRQRPTAYGTGVPLPSASPPPQDTPLPASPPGYRDHTTALLHENAAFRKREAELEDRLQRYQAILEEKRLRTIAPPPEKRTVPQWAAGLVAVIAALGAAGAFKVLEAMTAKPTVAPVELQQKEKDSRARDTAVLDYLAGLDQDEQRRNQIQLDVLCSLLGGPPSRGVKCRESACEPRALQNGKIVPGQPLCRSKLEWPARRRPPKEIEPEP